MDFRDFAVILIIGFTIALLCITILGILELMFSYAQEAIDNPYDSSRSKIYIPNMSFTRYD